MEKLQVFQSCKKGFSVSKVIFMNYWIMRIPYPVYFVSNKPGGMKFGISLLFLVFREKKNVFGTTKGGTKLY
jgi:hypothetical protein